MLIGKIKFFNRKNKFGFIIEEKSKSEYYFYIKNPKEELNSEDLVSFELKQAKRGLEGINITKVTSVNVD